MGGAATYKGTDRHLDGLVANINNTYCSFFRTDNTYNYPVYYVVFGIWFKPQTLTTDNHIPT